MTGAGGDLPAARPNQDTTQEQSQRFDPLQGSAGSDEMRIAMSRTITVEHEGRDYAATVMTIKSTSLGTEDHGIFTFQLHCEAPGSGVSVGGYGLDAWNEDARERLGVGVGLQFIKEVMSTIGVREWEKIPGRQVLVLWRGGGGPGDMAVGVAHLTDDSNVMPFDVWWENAKTRGLDGVSA